MERPSLGDDVGDAGQHGSRCDGVEVQRLLNVEPAARGDLAVQIGDVIHAAQDRLPNFGRGRFGIPRPEQRRRSADKRRGHAGPGPRAVVATRFGAEDVQARSGQVYGRRSEVAVDEQMIGRVHRRHADDVRRRTRRRQTGVRIGVEILRHLTDTVPGRRDQQHPGSGVRGNRIGQRLRRGRLRGANLPTVVRQPHIRRVWLVIDEVLSEMRDVVQRADRIGHIAMQARIQELHDHDLRGPVDSGDAGRVVPRRRQDAGDVRAVSVLIERI